MIYRCREYYLCFVSTERSTEVQETEREDNNSCDICFQASYETLYHSYLTSNKAESLSSDTSGPGEAAVDRTAEVMQAILQVETSKRACVIM